MKKSKELKLRKIEEKYSDSLMSIRDLTVGENLSPLFFPLVKFFGFMLDADPEKTISAKGVKIRKRVGWLLRTLAPVIMLRPHTIEDRNELLGAEKYKEGKKISLSKEPVIWVLNHGFKDDGLSTVVAAGRNAWFLFGSLPHFFSSFDGVAAWYNGSVLVNRNHRGSKQAAMKKLRRVLELGGDIIVFPEGVWNLSPNRLLLDFWPGIYRLAKETGAKIVPTIHYIRDKSEKTKGEKIHTVVDEPIDVSGMEEEEALDYIRDVMATWYYLMMEKYGQSTRAEIVGEHTDLVALWNAELVARYEHVGRYDFEVELKAAYIPSDYVDPIEVWRPLAEIEKVTAGNIGHVLAARQAMDIYRANDFQRKVLF